VKKKNKILVDMSASIIHHGHVRLIKKAAKFGKVIIALTTDKELINKKKIIPELKYKYRREILMEMQNVYKVIPSPFELKQKYLDKNKIDIIVQGSDYKKRKFKNKSITFNRTKNISSSIIRKLAIKNIK
jgi:glycerol-3-phosphate cytidylyltransferase